MVERKRFSSVVEKLVATCESNADGLSTFTVESGSHFRPRSISSWMINQLGTEFTRLLLVSDFDLQSTGPSRRVVRGVKLEHWNSPRFCRGLTFETTKDRGNSFDRLIPGVVSRRTRIPFSRAFEGRSARNTDATRSRIFHALLPNPRPL